MTFRKRPVYLGIWLTTAEYRSLAARAERETKGNQSEMTRRLVAYAIDRMPVDWPMSWDKSESELSP
jgi:hypothetical protein